ncbi:MAG: hypothetical protein JWO79_2769, partial [Actinomycetia bacterium]|nr:hypothetical protein [Actinomycetes bacterium]
SHATDPNDAPRRFPTHGSAVTVAGGSRSRLPHFVVERWSGYYIAEISSPFEVSPSRDQKKDPPRPLLLAQLILPRIVAGVS